MSDEKSILDDIFETEEEQVKSFADILIGDTEESKEAKKAVLSRKVEKGSLVDGQDASKFEQAEPDKISAPTLKVLRSGFIEMSCGWHKDDYVWHIKPWHAKKQYRVTIQRVLYAIAKCMRETVPDNTDVDVFMPNYKWDIPEITFKAKDLLNVWSVKDADLDKLNDKLFEVLNALV